MKFEINISPLYKDYNRVLDIINKINNKEDVSKDLRKLYGLYQDIPEAQSTIRDHDLCWAFLSSNVILSEEFIRENANNVQWDYIGQEQKLSENFIREFKDNLSWYYVFKRQTISDDFIEEHMQVFDSDFQYGLFENKQIDESFIIRHINNIDTDSMLSDTAECIDVFSLSKETQKLLIEKFIFDKINRFKRNIDSEGLRGYILTPYMKEEYFKYSLLS